MSNEVNEKKGGRLIALLGKSGTGKTSQLRTFLDLETPFGPGTGSKRLVGHKPLKTLYGSSENKFKCVEDLIGRKSWHEGGNVYPIQAVDFPLDAEDKADMITMGSSDLIKMFDMLRTEDHGYDALYWDGPMRWGWKLLNHLKATTVSERTGKKDTLKAYGLFGQKMKAMLDTLSTLTDPVVAKNPVHVVCTWGIKVGEDFKGQRLIGASIEGKMITQDEIEYFFDDVLMMAMQKGDNGESEYVMHTKGTGEFNAKVSSILPIPGTIVNPNLHELIKVLDGEVKL